MRGDRACDEDPLPVQELDFDLLVLNIGLSAEAKAQKEAMDNAKKEMETTNRGGSKKANVGGKEVQVMYPNEHTWHLYQKTLKDQQSKKL